MLPSITPMLHMIIVGIGFGMIGSWDMAQGTILGNNHGSMGSQEL